MDIAISEGLGQWGNRVWDRWVDTLNAAFVCHTMRRDELVAPFTSRT